MPLNCMAWTASHALSTSPLDLHKVAQVFHILHGLGLERLNGELLFHCLEELDLPMLL